MMDILANAFAKAGLPPASTSFAAACHDLARLALNREPDPARATAVWVGMAHQPAFKAALKEFLQFVAAEDHLSGAQKAGHASFLPAVTKPSIVASEDQPEIAIDGHIKLVSLAAIPLSAGEDQSGGGGDAQHLAVPPAEALPPVPETTAGDGQSFGARNGHISAATPAVAQRKIDAATEARRITVAAQSGFVVTEHNGSVVAIEALNISRIPSLKRIIGRRNIRAATEWFLLDELAKKLPAFAPSGHTVLDVFSAGEIRSAGEGARERAAMLFMVPTEAKQIGAMI